MWRRRHHRRLKTLIINFKNYAAVQGEGSVSLARAAERVSREVRAKIIVAPPSPMLALTVSKVGIPVFSQSVGIVKGEKTTGAVLPEAVREAGAAGTILNHSEARLERAVLPELVTRLRRLGLKTCLCARDSREAAAISRLGPEYLAVEPPELIGSGIAVSRAKPQVVAGTVAAARKAGYKGKVLCGAGIVSGEDVRIAIELGADGVLVSSSVVMAKDWAAKIGELARSLY